MKRHETEHIAAGIEGKAEASTVVVMADDIV